jgi:hypothetical protein
VAIFHAGVTSLVDAGLAKELEHIEHELLGDGDANAFPLIPSEGMSPEAIISVAKELKQQQQVSRPLCPSCSVHSDGTALAGLDRG